MRVRGAALSSSAQKHAVALRLPNTCIFMWDVLSLDVSSQLGITVVECRTKIGTKLKLVSVSCDVGLVCKEASGRGCLC